jgi:small subunit ribosomal protein S3
MGQKVNPNIIRVGITKPGKSRWFARKKGYTKNLHQDIQLRKFIKDELKEAGIIETEIERKSGLIHIIISSSRPGVIIGREGSSIDKFKAKLNRKFNDNFDVTIKEVKNAEQEAAHLADMIARQIEKRFPFRRAMKNAISKAMESGVKGVKIQLGGRLGGAEIARSEKASKGKIPLHTFRADISYAQDEANTTYGVIGVKVWTYRGDIFKKRVEQLDKGL